MKYRRGNMFSETPSETNIILFTANSVVNSNGELVMGAGAAKEARDKYPGLNWLLGQELLRRGQEYRPGVYSNPYGVLLASSNWVGAFQTKYNWARPSSLGLVAFSLDILKVIAQINSHITYHVNMPGTGLGGLKRKEVVAEIDALDLTDNVNIWEY